MYVIKGSKNSMNIQIDEEGDIDTDAGDDLPPGDAVEAEGDERLLKLWILSVISLVGLFAGGRLAVSASTQIAQSLGLDEVLIGLTVVALATTAPEMITSIMAALKKEPDIVLGNCIGSNIFNILLVLGLSSTLSPISVDAGLWLDTAIMVALTVFVFVISWARKAIKSASGIILLLMYIAYLAYKVITVLLIF